MLFGVVRDKLHRVDGKRFDAPGGLWIDEVSRHTMLYADGRPAFRQRSDKFIDSLLLTKGQTPSPMRFAVGIDVPSPTTAARALIAPPQSSLVRRQPIRLHPVGWFTVRPRMRLFVTFRRNRTALWLSRCKSCWYATSRAP